MSKNFEEEYKALAENDLPDLWNRIEAGLTPRSTVSESGEADRITRKQEQIIDKPEGRADHNKVIQFFLRYKTVAAAAICVIIILPAVLVLGNLNSGKSKTTELCEEAMDAAAPMEEGLDTAAAAAETAAETAEAVTEEPVEEEMADEAFTDSMSDMSSSVENDVEEAVTEDMATGALQDKEAETENERSSGSTADGAAEKITELEKEEKQLADAGGEEKASEIIYQNVTVKILERTEEEVTTQGDWFHGMKAEVVSSQNDGLKPGDELTIWVSLASSTMYIVGEEYKLDISYDPDRECDYRIAATHF